MLLNILDYHCRKMSLNVAECRNICDNLVIILFIMQERLQETRERDLREIARETRLRRHELRELGVKRATRNWRAEKESLQREHLQN